MAKSKEWIEFPVTLINDDEIEDSRQSTACIRRNRIESFHPNEPGKTTRMIMFSGDEFVIDLPHPKVRSMILNGDD